MKYRVTIQSSRNARRVAAGKAQPRITEKIITAKDETELQAERSRMERRYKSRNPIRWIHYDYIISAERIG